MEVHGDVFTVASRCDFLQILVRKDTYQLTQRNVIPFLRNRISVGFHKCLGKNTVNAHLPSGYADRQILLI